MASTEVVSNLSNIAGGLVMNIVYGVGVIVFAVILWYALRWYQKNSKKQKAFTITAIIIDKNGDMDFDKLAFLKNPETELIEMILQKRKQDSLPPIPKNMIKNGIIFLYNYAPGQYAPIKPETWSFKDNFKILLEDINMKNFLFLRQRALINKSEALKKKISEYLPWITLSATILIACIFAALFIYLGSWAYTNAVAERVLECKGVM